MPDFDRWVWEIASSSGMSGGRLGESLVPPGETGGHGALEPGFGCEPGRCLHAAGRSSTHDAARSLTVTDHREPVSPTASQ
jgi:hypothetical protein